MSASPAHRQLVGLPLASLNQPLLETQQEVAPELSTEPAASLSIKTEGWFLGVFVPTCENMWGIVIFLRLSVMVLNSLNEPSPLYTLLSRLLLCASAALFTAVCLSALASSGGPVSEGGPYFMISRSLGMKVGASVGLVYWAGIIMLAVMEALGAVELLVSLVPPLKTETRIITGMFIVSLGYIVSKGTATISRLGAIFAVAAFTSVSLLATGLLFKIHRSDSHNPNSHSPAIFSNSAKTQTSNVIGLMFTLYAGIFSGADRAEILRNSTTDIPKGTFSAVIFSTVVYCIVIVLWYWALLGMPEGEATRGDRRLRSHGTVMMDWAISGEKQFPGFIMYFGVFATCIAQVLQCFVVAPRILRDIALDRALPWLAYLSPERSEISLWFSVSVGVGLSMIGSLDAAAPFASLAFLVCYGSLNLACLLQSALNPPTWRPQISRFSLILASSFGTALCGWLIMEIGTLMMRVLIFVMAVMLFVGVSFFGERAEWGSGLDGLKLAAAMALIGRGEISSSGSTWRPHVLIVSRTLTKKPSAISERQCELSDLLILAAQLKRGRGLTVVVGVLETAHLGDRGNERSSSRFGFDEEEQSDEEEFSPLHRTHEQSFNNEPTTPPLLTGAPDSCPLCCLQKEEISQFLVSEGVSGFAEVVVAESVGQVVPLAVQISGVGALKPNTLLMAWPQHASHQVRVEFVRSLDFAISRGKAVLALRSVSWPAEEPKIPCVDIWWFMQDGGLLLCLSWLLMQHQTWRNAKVRIFIASSPEPEIEPEIYSEEVESKLRNILKRSQVLQEAQVTAVILEEPSMLEPYTGRVVAEGVSESDAGTNRRGSLAPTSSFVSDTILPNIDAFVHERRSSFLRPSQSPSPTDIEAHRSTSGLASPRAVSEETARLLNDLHIRLHPSSPVATPRRAPDARTFERLNRIVRGRSSHSDLVLINLPNVWSVQYQDCLVWLAFCDTLTTALKRVLFVHSAGHEGSSFF